MQPLLAKNSQAPRSFRKPALSLTFFASKLAPTKRASQPSRNGNHDAKRAACDLDLRRPVKPRWPEFDGDLGGKPAGMPVSLGPQGNRHVPGMLRRDLVGCPGSAARRDVRPEMGGRSPTTSCALPPSPDRATTVIFSARARDGADGRAGRRRRSEASEVGTSPASGLPALACPFWSRRLRNSSRPSTAARATTARRATTMSSTIRRPRRRRGSARPGSRSRPRRRPPSRVR